VVYNDAAIERADITGMIQDHGFDLLSAASASTRAGAKIVIPPNQIA
jgi:hypothetical protein